MLSLIQAIIIVTLSNAQSAPFTEAQIAQMRGYFEANIGLSNCAPGFLVASPSGGANHNSGDPDYYYHWQRDAAVSMHTLQYTANSNEFDAKFKNYVKWVQSAQTKSDPNGQNVLGEPKFNCDGSVYSGGWCRPQNDGPASRALALITYANYLLDNGDIDYVKTNLFSVGSSNNTKTCQVEDANKVDCGYVGIDQTECQNAGCCWYEIDNNPNNVPWCYYKGGSGGGSGAIPVDLNYVTTVWSDGQSCDLWEEVRGTMFYTAMVQRYALYYGAALAKRLNDTATASNWQSTAASIDNTIKQFDKGGTIQDTSRQWDCSVIVGSLYGGTPDEFQPNTAEMFPPSNKDILNTVSQIKSYWDSTYAINKEDDSNNIPGSLIGRYADDHYPGCDGNGGSKGHAWILCSNALADIYYRNALYLHTNKRNAKELLTPQHLEIYANLYEKDQSKAANLLRAYSTEWSDSIRGGYDIDYEAIMETVAAISATQGDNQLQRVSYHVGIDCGNEYHLSEQICEVSSQSGGGQEVGAHDLTWSYGTVLSAWHYRTQAIQSGVVFYPNEKAVDDMVLAAAKYGLGQSCGAGLCNGQCKD